MQKKQMNEKEVYRAAKLRELINKERRGDRVPTLSKNASDCRHYRVLVPSALILSSLFLLFYIL